MPRPRDRYRRNRHREGGHLNRRRSARREAREPIAAVLSRRSALLSVLVGCTAVGLDACAAGPEITTRPVSFLLDGAEANAEWVEAKTPVDKGIALVLCGAAPETPAFLRGLSIRLSGAGFVSTHLTPEGRVGSAEIAEALTQLHVSRPTIPLSLIAFGASGPEAWNGLVGASDVVTSAVFISCGLPVPLPDFAACRQVAVRGISAQAGTAQASSYTDAHLGLAAVGAPHDFKIYGGGVTDEFYDLESPAYHEGTWRAAQDDIVEWLEVRGYLGRPEGIEAAHDH